MHRAGWHTDDFGIGRAFALVVGVASLIGAAAGWAVSQVFVHLRTRGASSHPAAAHHPPRAWRG